MRAISLFEHETEYFKRKPQDLKKLLCLFKRCETSNRDLLRLQASFLKENIYPFLCDNLLDKFPEDDIKKEWVLLRPTLSLDYQEAQNRMDVLAKNLSLIKQDKILTDEAPSNPKSGFKAGNLENKHVSNKLKESELVQKLEISSPSLQEQTSVDAFRQLISKKPIRDVSLVMNTFERIKKEGKATSDLYQTYINILQSIGKFKEALEAFEEEKKLKPVI